MADRRTVCTGFARFWVWMLAQQGIRADFVAFWSDTSAHAVAVFRDRQGRFRMGSNANFYVTAAMEFYGAGAATLVAPGDRNMVSIRQ